MNEGLVEFHYYESLDADDKAARVFKPHVVGAVHRRKSKFTAGIPSPHPGVTFDKARNKWQAYVGGGKIKRVKLGRFDTAEEAKAAIEATKDNEKINPLWANS